MRRKRIIGIAAVVCMLFCLVGCGRSEDQVVLLMADVQEGDHPTAVACDKFAEMVYDRTDGRVKVEVYHGDTLGSEAEQMQQIKAGGIDLARVSGPVANYNPDFKAFQALYLYESEDQMWDILNGKTGDDLLESEILAENNMVGLCWFSGGSRNFYNSKKEITCPADMKGLTFRVTTDSMFALLEKNGAKGINIAYNDIYSSMSEGVIDGAENNWPSYLSTGHYEKAKYITVDQHQCIPEIIVASKSCLDSLSKEDRAIVEECAKEISEYQIKAMKEYEEKAIKQVQKEGVKVTYLSDKASKEFRAQGKEINETVSAEYADAIKMVTGK